MAEIINTFHIDWRIIIAQLVNFSLVVAVLWYFAFKPLAKTMGERTTRIEQSLKNADAVTEQLARAESEYQAMVTKAKKEAEQIIVTAKATAERERVEAVERTKTEAAKVIESSKAQLARQREQMVQEARAELADIVAIATGKVISEKLTSDRDKALIEKTITETKRV
jgi:F-type H+-transporting ATPase subunit b